MFVLNVNKIPSSKKFICSFLYGCCVLFLFLCNFYVNDIYIRDRSPRAIDKQIYYIDEDQQYLI